MDKSLLDTVDKYMRPFLGGVSGSQGSAAAASQFYGLPAGEQENIFSPDELEDLMKSIFGDY